MKDYLFTLKNMPSKKRLDNDDCMGMEHNGRIEIWFAENRTMLLADYTLYVPAGRGSLFSIKGLGLTLSFKEKYGWTEELRNKVVEYIEQGEYGNEYEYYIPIVPGHPDDEVPILRPVVLVVGEKI